MTHAVDDETSGPVIGSGNFLADRGYAEAEGTRLKIRMANDIALIVEDRRLTQRQVSELTGLAQPDVSRIVNRLVRDYSVERLMLAMTALGKDVHVGWGDARKGRGSIVVDVAERPEEERSFAF